MIILEVLLEPRLTQVDSGAYPRGGRFLLEAFASVGPYSMNRMVRFSTDHCWKKENFCRVAYCGKVALLGHPRDVLAWLFVPLGESE